MSVILVVVRRVGGGGVHSVPVLPRGRGSLTRSGLVWGHGREVEGRGADGEGQDDQ